VVRVLWSEGTRRENRGRAVRKIVTVALSSYSIGVQLCSLSLSLKRYFLLDPLRRVVRNRAASLEHRFGVEFMSSTSRCYCANYLAKKKTDLWGVLHVHKIWILWKRLWELELFFITFCPRNDGFSYVLAVKFMLDIHIKHT